MIILLIPMLAIIAAYLAIEIAALRRARSHLDRMLAELATSDLNDNQ